MRVQRTLGFGIFLSLAWIVNENHSKYGTTTDAIEIVWIMLDYLERLGIALGSGDNSGSVLFSSWLLASGIPNELICRGSIKL
jgi:hypothetical protein